MSDVVKWARDGLRGARAQLNRGEKPGLFITSFGGLSDADKALVMREVPGFERKYIALCYAMPALAARRACDREVRGGTR